MKRSMGTFAILSLAGISFALAALFVFAYAYRRGESYAESSSFRATKDGLRAFALLLEARQFKVSRLQEEWSLKDRKGVLISLGSPKDEPGRIKPAELLEWVAAGNTALLLCPLENSYLGALDLSLMPLSASSGIAQSRSSNPLTRDAPSLSLRSGRCFDVRAKDYLRFEALYAVDDRPVALRMTWGGGEIVLISDVFLASNVGLPEADNVIFLLNAAGRGGDVMFDETGSRLMFGEPGVLGYARRAGVHWVFLELAILALLWLWQAGARVGPPVERRPPEPRAAADFVTGCAMLYEQANMSRSVVRILLETLRDDVRQGFGLRGPYSQEKAEAAMEGDAVVRARYIELVKKGQVLSRQSSLKNSDVIAFSFSVHDFRNELLWKPETRPRSARRTSP